MKTGTRADLRPKWKSSRHEPSLKPHGPNSWMSEWPARSTSTRRRYWSARLRLISPCLHCRLQLHHRRFRSAFPRPCWKGVPILLAAERRVASANAQVGLAKTAYYPLVNIVGSGGFESGTITTLLQGPSGLWSVGSSAVVTLFDVGRRRAVNDEAKASYDSSVASYRETVLTAFQQVEDNLAALRVLEHEAGVQATAVESAQRSLEPLKHAIRRRSHQLSRSHHCSECCPVRRGYSRQHSGPTHGERSAID